MLLRDALCAKPILQFPDFTKPFVVTTDASGYAIGGVLSQVEIGKDLPVAYTSRLLNNAEKNYSTIEKELLAIICCVNYFRPYICGRKFTLATDHRPLVWIHAVTDPTSRLIRWRLKLAEYEYNVIYKPGKVNDNADALSRNPVPTRTKQILPLERNRELGSSEESLFNAKRQKGGETPRNFEEAPRQINNAPRQIEINPHESEETHRPTKGNSDTDDSPHPRSPSEPDVSSEPSDVESDDNSDSTDDTCIFDNPSEPFIRKTQTGPRVITIPDGFSTRKDNLVVFVTQQGTPIDLGARVLHENKSYD